MTLYRRGEELVDVVARSPFHINSLAAQGFKEVTDEPATRINIDDQDEVAPVDIPVNRKGKRKK